MQAVAAGILGAFVLFLGVAGFGGNSLAEDGPFANASLHGTYTYVSLFNDVAEPFPNAAIVGMMYFDGEGNWVFANLITNLPGEPDREGEPTRFLMNALDDLTPPWPHVRGTYSVNPDGSFRFLIENGEGAFDGVVKRAEPTGGQLTITEAIMIDTSPNRFGDGLVVFDLWRIVEQNILPRE